MTCSVHQTVLPKSKGVRVNGVAIARDVIAREVQHHPARTPAESLKAAARALVVRELLLQEARRLEIEATRCPMRTAGAKPPRKPRSAPWWIGRSARRRPMWRPAGAITSRTGSSFAPRTSTKRPIFCSPRARLTSRLTREAQAAAETALDVLRSHPERFADLAQALSACSSASQGGNLGQITEGQTTPEFEQALFALEPGTIAPLPVATRYGFHIIRLDRKHDGRQLPFELVADRIVEYLQERVQRRALAQYIARLASAAKIEGVDLTSAEAMRVN